MLGRYCAVLPASAAAAATCCCHLLLLLPLLLLLVQAYCRCRCWAQRHAPGRRPPREPQRLAHPPARGGRRHRHATARSSRRRSRLYSTYYDAYVNMHTRVWCGAERRSTDRVRTSRSRLRNPKLLRSVGTCRSTSVGRVGVQASRSAAPAEARSCSVRAFSSSPPSIGRTGASPFVTPFPSIQCHMRFQIGSCPPRTPAETQTPTILQTN